MSSHAPKLRHLAFTIVELLVVISIIGVLIAMILPSINKARENAKLSVCLSNLHQVSLASATYVLDFRDTHPPIWVGSLANRSQIYWLGKKGYSGGYATTDATVRYLNPYIGKFGADSEVLIARCPSDERDTIYGPSSFYNTHGASYAANATGPNFAHINSMTVNGPAPASLYGIRGSSVRDPSRTVLMAEFGAYDPVWSNIDPGPAFRWHDINAISSTAAFVGGHAKLLYLTRGVYYNDIYSFDITK